MPADCIRTIDDEPCTDCKRLTNAYDSMMGRLCPQCIARRGTQFGYRLSHPDYLFDHHTITEEEVKNDPVNEYLYDAPLIDHSDDIDKKFAKS